MDEYENFQRLRDSINNHYTQAIVDGGAGILILLSGPALYLSRDSFLLSKIFAGSFAVAAGIQLVLASRKETKLKNLETKLKSDI
jgi:hypothetical protein